MAPSRMRNCSVTASGSTPPAALRTPAIPPGIEIATSLRGMNPVDGMNVISLPEIFQAPADVGVMVGVDEFVASFDEKRKMIAAPLATPVAPEDGVIDTTLRSAAVATVVDVESWCGALADLGWELPLSVLVTIAPTPTPRRRTAPTIPTTNARECRSRTR